VRKHNFKITRQDCDAIYVRKPDRRKTTIHEHYTNIKKA